MKKNKQPGKPTFVAGIKARLRELVRLCGVLFERPREFPRELGQSFKRGVQGLWNARGGGFYACGFVVTFIWLELRTIVSELAASDSAVDFLSQQLFEMFFRLLSESFVNSLLSFIWPVYVIQWSPAWGLGILAVLYVAFASFIKAPLTNWLFDEKAPETPGDSKR